MEEMIAERKIKDTVAIAGIDVLHRLLEGIGLCMELGGGTRVVLKRTEPELLEEFMREIGEPGGAPAIASVLGRLFSTPDKRSDMTTVFERKTGLRVEYDGFAYWLRPLNESDKGPDK